MRLASLLVVLLALAACDSSESTVGPNSTVIVAYEGRLEDGTVFDQSSRATLSLRRVIPGFRDGMIGMSEGETRIFSIPPEQGYGNQQVGPIPPNSTLIFEVTLLAIQ